MYKRSCTTLFFFICHCLLFLRVAVFKCILQRPVHHFEYGFWILTVTSNHYKVVYRITVNHDCRLLSVRRKVWPNHPVGFRMLYLIGIQRPVGNPPGCGNDCIFSLLQYHLLSENPPPRYHMRQNPSEISLCYTTRSAWSEWS